MTGDDFRCPQTSKEHISGHTCIIFCCLSWRLAWGWQDRISLGIQMSCEARLGNLQPLHAARGGAAVQGRWWIFFGRVVPWKSEKSRPTLSHKRPGSGTLCRHRCGSYNHKGDSILSHLPLIRHPCPCLNCSLFFHCMGLVTTLYYLCL